MSRASAAPPLRGDHHGRQRPLGAAAGPAGHRGPPAGTDAVKRACGTPVELGIEELTVYAFSTENWTRPREEVDGLMAMFAERIDARDARSCDEEGVRLRFIGRRDRRRAELLRADRLGRGADRRPTTGSRCSSPSTTAAGRRSWTRRERFTGATRRSSARHLYAPDMQDPDLIIRTSGELRLSNFLLWQSRLLGARLPDELWPDFDRAAFEPRWTSSPPAERRFGAR